MRLIRQLGIVLLSIGWISETQAKPKGSKPKGNLLDTVAIHQIYLDGDFEEAIDRIETAIQYGGPFSHEDSVFAFKHLGVMYTAKYETREKGKQYMMRLLQVEPSARIMDMYASDMIYMIFKNIKDEFDMSQAKLNRAKDQLGFSPSDNTKAPAEKNEGIPAKGESGKKSRGYAWMGWTAGALAITGGAVILIHVNEKAPKPSREENVLK